MKLCQTLLFLAMSIFCQSQAIMKGKDLDLVFRSAYTGYSELRGDLDVTQLPDTLYSSTITLEGTINNYIRVLSSHASGYFSTIGEDMTLSEAKGAVEHWKSLISKTIRKHTLKGEKVHVVTLGEASYIIFKNDGKGSMQIFIQNIEQEASDKHDALLYFMYAKTTLD